MGVTQRILGLTPLSRDQWLLSIGCAIALTLVYEVIKVFLRRHRGLDAAVEVVPAAPAIAAEA